MTKLWVPCLVIAFLFMQYQLWFMPGGLINAKKTNQEIAQLEQKNNAMADKNHELVLGIDHLKQNHQAIEAEARNELGMIKHNEVFYRVVED